MITLYMVATPIGNLEDITLRALRVLRDCDLLVCEDTKQTAKLAEKYEIIAPRTSFHAQTSPRQLEVLVQKIMQCESVCFVSDAGTPCVSDPGYKLLQSCMQQGIHIVPIPGPCALTTLMSVAGIPTHDIRFHGFLPHKKGRQTLITSLKDSTITHGFYESVHRFPKLLQQLSEYIGDSRIIVVGRELTKMHEDIFRGTVSDAKKYFTKENIRGEFVVLVAPARYQL